ncbi:hypothetical protein [Leptospira alexanderi]|uniref:hypothetical protein n=1 Tax=Leptospira alexanderi TaxID=100053 RepID=UPI000991431C|nr:hypothetical protein [Leptospira alexanderi]
MRITFKLFSRFPERNNPIYSVFQNLIVLYGKIKLQDSIPAAAIHRVVMTGTESYILSLLEPTMFNFSNKRFAL